MCVFGGGHSTCATYGNADVMPITEATPTVPINPYGKVVSPPTELPPPASTDSARARVRAYDARLRWGWGVSRRGVTQAKLAAERVVRDFASAAPEFQSAILRCHVHLTSWHRPRHRARSKKNVCRVPDSSAFTGRGPRCRRVAVAPGRVTSRETPQSVTVEGVRTLPMTRRLR